MINKQVCLILAHTTHRGVLKSLNAISSAFEDFGDTFLLLHVKDKSSLKTQKIEHPVHPFSDTTLAQSGYNMLSGSIVPGSAHIPVIEFYKQHPEYTYYWLIEYDVRYSGSWREFFTTFTGYPHDLITSHIRYHNEEPHWPWWNLESPGEEIPMEERIRAFNTIYRISSGALKFLSTYLLNGTKGHYEMLYPTLLHRHSFSLLDFGGDGSFVPDELKNKFYISSDKNNKNLNSGTMRFKPPFLVYGLRKNKLYHPIKDVKDYVKHYKGRINDIINPGHE